MNDQVAFGLAIALALALLIVGRYLQSLRGRPPMPRKIRFCKPALLPSSGSRESRGKAERDKFYSGAKWRKLRLAFLSENPLCKSCSLEGRLTAATIVHHVKERLDDEDLAYDWDNLEAACSRCHTKHHKKAHTDG